MQYLTTSRYRSALESVEKHLRSKLLFTVGNENQPIMHDMETAQIILENAEQIGDATVIHHTRTGGRRSMARLTGQRIVSFLESAECHLQSNLRRAVGNERQPIKHDLETIRLMMQRLDSIGDATVIHHTRVDTQLQAAE